MDRVILSSLMPDRADAAAAAPISLASFTTARLRIRPLERRDVDAVFAMRSDPRVTEPYCQEPYASIDKASKWVEERVSERERRGSPYWAFTLRGDDTAIGSCCLWNIDHESHKAEIGYELNAAYW